MMKIPQYKNFARKILACKNLFELRDVVKEINEFNKNNSIRSSSDDFKRLETYLGLMKIKLRNKQGVFESKIPITEQYNPDRLYPKEEIIKILKSAPKELKYILKKLPSIPCENENGIRTVCTRIPETLFVYLTGRY
jgi:hypothetical protein